MKMFIVSIPVVFFLAGCVSTKQHKKEVMVSFDHGYVHGQSQCFPELISCQKDRKEKDAVLRKFNQVDEAGNLYYKDEGY